MLSDVIRHVTRGHRVHLVVLAELRFASRTMHVHNEGGILLSRGFDGEIEDTHWRGLEGAARVSNLGASRIGSARSVTVTLDATDAEIRETFADQTREVKGRRFVFWGQFFSVDLEPLDPRFHIYTGIGDRLTLRKSGPSTRTMTLMLEDYVVRRRRSGHAHVTHADQQARDPGNTGFLYVPRMADHTLNLFDVRD